jgi:hypothetical protein
MDEHQDHTVHFNHAAHQLVRQNASRHSPKKKVLPDAANKTGYHSGTCILYLQISRVLFNHGILNPC